MTRRVSVWFVSPAWRRFAVTRLVLAQRRRLCADLAARGLDAHSLVVADDENLDIAREYGSVALEHPNQPLGRKWNAGITYACREGGADFVVYLGSDDWAHASLFDPLPWHGHAGRMPIVTGRRIAFVDLWNGRLMRCTTRGGVIPWIIPRAELEPSGFAPVEPSRQVGLDRSLRTGLRDDVAWTSLDPHPLARVDFKSPTQITPYAGLASLADGPEEPLEALAELYPADLVALARATHEEVSQMAGYVYVGQSKRIHVGGFGPDGATLRRGEPVELTGRAAEAAERHPLIQRLEGRPAAPAAAPSGLAERAALVARAKALGIRASGRSDELRAAIAAAEAGGG